MTRTDRLNGKAAAVSAVLLLCISAANPSGCSQSVRVGEEIPSDGGAPLFVVPDATTADASRRLTEYCPSNKCPSGYTTCATSRFPCDVNLMADRNNCGECGFACQATGLGGPPGAYECVDGRCVLSCASGNVFKTFDCDGAPDNGCESNNASNDSCGNCGVACTDAAKPCLRRFDLAENYGCGCAEGQILCSGQCVDPKSDDANCSACGNRCPRYGGPALDPALPHVLRLRRG